MRFPTRALLGGSLLVALVSQAALLMGGRPEPRDPSGAPGLEATLLDQEARRLLRQAPPAPVAPPAEFAPFGRTIAPRYLQGDAARGRLLTSLGHVDWDASRDDIAAAMPADLRLGPAEARPSRRGTLRPGLDYVLLDAALLSARGADAALRSVQDHARIVGVLPEATLVVWVEPGDLAALAADPFVARTRALEPFHKIDPGLGTLPRLSRREAANPDLLATIAVVPGHDGPEFRRRLEALPGVGEVSPFASEGAGYQLRVNYRSVKDLARQDAILSIAPVPEFLLANAENVPSIQAGSAEDAAFIRPFDDAGVDGGGIDTNGDGRRINDGTDTVPPQIVTIVDNGISPDTPSFSQTATQVRPGATPFGPKHRKIQAIQTVVDSGTSCDATLSGGTTHGNVVASAIAAYPSYFGVYATKSGIGGTAEPRAVNLDGVARGARIIMEDAATTATCLINSLVEHGGNISPGALIDRLTLAECPATGGTGACSGVVGGGSDTHLAVFPFGVPNWSTDQFALTNGQYDQAAVDTDTFLYNNRDFMVVAPVGNNGGLVTDARLDQMTPVYPDAFYPDQFFVPNQDLGYGIEVTAPATAKNVISVGSSMDDCFTLFGTTDCEGRVNAFTSRGPATLTSGRTAPILTAPSFDLLGTPYTGGVAVFASSDNDLLEPVEARLSEGNYGTSYSAAYVTGAGAVVRDYFAQGFYPTATRGPASDRMPLVSGALVKAALAASADFGETGITIIAPATDHNGLIRRTRAADLGTGPFGGNIGIWGNNEQGYGRPVLTDVLPLANWSRDFVLHPDSGAPKEYPAAGLLVWDQLATGEPPINNTTNTSRTHLFRLAGARTVTTAAGGLAVAPGQLRLALAWIDRPSPAGSGGPIVNDLDLTLEGPGADNCLDATDVRPDGTACPVGSDSDNVFYDGNRYGLTGNAILDQWSKPRGASGAVHDARNPLEAIHLTADPDSDNAYGDSPLYVGRWRVTVGRGSGGSLAGQITMPGGPGLNEDVNGNGRLDPGEDTNANGLLDLPGQTYALVVSGAVFLDEAAPPAGPASFPRSGASFDRIRYTCADGAILSILDTTPGAGPARSSASTTFTVLNPAGAVTDTETAIGFVAGSGPGQSVSAAVPVRLASPSVPGNGVLEADTGSTIVADYAPAGQRAVEARAVVNCQPDVITGAFLGAGGQSVGDTVSISAGCDNDPFPDAGEVVAYGVAFQNRSRSDDYVGVSATLAPSGPGAAAIRVLDSPQTLDRLPAGMPNGVFFHVYVDPAAIGALAVAARVVDMTLTLDSTVHGKPLDRQTFTFRHALNSDKEAFFYSTDHPAGGREVRDLNRNGVIDPPDQVDPFYGFLLPREDVVFSTLFSGSGAPAGHFTNELGEDLDLSGTLNGAERDVIPDGVVDRGILAGSAPSAADKVPWSFDANNGGFTAFRSPMSVPSNNVSPNPVWEYKTSGVCGFQTAGPVNAGIWHTGDGNPSTPPPAGPACDNYPMPSDTATPPKVEWLFDVLHSPIVAKVNQLADARGFPYTVEFQRLGLNENIQTYDGYAGGGINIDNDADNDNVDSLLRDHSDQYYARHWGGWPDGTFRLADELFSGPGIDPATTSPAPRTFGPFGTDDFGQPFGFTGYTTNGNPNSSSPIPTAPPDLLPYPLLHAAITGVCDGGTQAGAACAPSSPSDSCVTGGGVCHPQDDTDAGPVRNFDATLIGFEGGFASVIAKNPIENALHSLPGPAGNRWTIGVGFWVVESPGGNTDYGLGVDDVVFEWQEWHPRDEGDFGHTPACSRFGQPGQAAGGQCATVTVDRTTIYECEGTFEVMVFDAKCIVVGAGAGVPLGGACTTDAQCGTGGTCTAARASVQVAVTTDSDGVRVTTSQFDVMTPASKRFTLPAVPGTPGLYRGTLTLSTVANDANHVFVKAATDRQLSVYYFDPLCDGDRDGQAGENDFSNLDGDGVPSTGFAASCHGGATAGCKDNCPFVYNPAQADADNDGVGDLCDNCPGFANGPNASILVNDNQTDSNLDGIGDVCEFTDYDGAARGGGDGFPDNAGDNCPGVRNPNQGDVDGDGRGDLCDTMKSYYCNGANATGSPFCAGPVNNCNTSTHLCQLSGTCAYPAPAPSTPCDFSGSGSNPISAFNPCPGIAGVCNPTTHVCSAGQVGNACAVNTDCNVDSLLGASQFGGCVMAFTSPPAMVGHACNASVDCEADLDRDGDGIVDALDNCPLTANPTQVDSDGDRMGDACDPDCAGTTFSRICRSGGGAGTSACSASCANNLGLINSCQWYITNSGSCSNVDDDKDADGVTDAVDDCPAIYNPPVVAGGSAQRDTDHDGLGDVCDPAGSFDDGSDGLPDDVAAFHATIACNTQPLAHLTFIKAEYQDLDGDHDAFPDTGETGRLRVIMRNDGASLTGVVLTLTSTDPNVTAITSGSVPVASIPAGATVTIGSFDPAQDGFTFTVSNTLQSPPFPAPPAQITLGLDAVANETLGLFAPISFSMLADLDIPGGANQVPLLGPDGIAGTADDATIVENFDIDKNGDGDYTVNDLFLEPTAPGVYRGHCSTAALTLCQTNADCPLDAGSNPGICYSGSYLHGTYNGTATGLMAGVTCGGFDTPQGNAAGNFPNPMCVLDPDFPMDWHLHCAPGSTHCPNNEKIPGTGTSRACVAQAPFSCSYNTPLNGAHSVSGTQSLHMGAHFDPTYAERGDTTHFRTLQGFVSAPFNLAISPNLIPTIDGQMTLSFHQIVDLERDSGEGNGGVGGGKQAGQCADCGNLQVQFDQNPDPNVDAWGFWQNLVPFENVYDNKVLAWSAFSSYYCVFTPTDAGTAPPNPHGFHETICFPQGAWANCGDVRGTTIGNTHRCKGPGVIDAGGVGTWVRTSFDLSGFTGQRVRVRWIGETWNFGAIEGSYYEVGNGWSDQTADDGWWIDDVTITGAVETQVTPVPDTKQPPSLVAGGPGGPQPAAPGDPCNEAVGDAGTNVVLDVTDLDNRAVDGAAVVPVAGQTLRISAARSTLPGGCAGGSIEFEIGRNGAVVQDFSPKPFILDGPRATAHYSARVRCSSDHACTSLIGAARDVGVASGDGGDVALGAWGSPFKPGAGVTYDAVAATTTLVWWVPDARAADVYRGVLAPGTTKGSAAMPFWRLDTTGGAGAAAACLRNDVGATAETAPPAGPGGTRGTTGPLDQAADPNPPIGAVVYYVVAADAPGGGSTNAAGCADPAICSLPGWCELGTTPGAPCSVAADCAGGGSCLPRQVFCHANAGVGGQGGCGRYPTCAGGTNAGRLCLDDGACPGSTCAFPPVATVTKGSVCLSVSAQAGALATGVVPADCPAAGNPARVVRQVGVAGLCP